MTVLAVGALWTVGSVPVALLIGRCMRTSQPVMVGIEDGRSLYLDQAGQLVLEGDAA